MTQYIDLQINGYAGVDFNADNLSDEDLHKACSLLREDGVVGILATIITDDIPQMASKLAKIVAIRQRDELVREVIWGFHIEGPFISPVTGFVGAHPPQFVRPANLDEMKRLLDAAGGLTRLVTLAPECDPAQKLTSFLAKNGIIVSAGHCDASLNDLRAAIDAGLSMFTHLGNGCPMLLNRHDNIIQRVFYLREHLTIGFIADGAHIPPMTLKNYLDLVGLERTVIVTDAISAARLGPGLYTLGSQSVRIGDDLVPRSPDNSHLVGSAATMPRMASILRNSLGFSDTDIQRVLYDNPKRVLTSSTA